MRLLLGTPLPLPPAQLPSLTPNEKERETVRVRVVYLNQLTSVFHRNGTKERERETERERERERERETGRQTDRQTDASFLL